jgi:hypothetical protein
LGRRIEGLGRKAQQRGKKDEEKEKNGSNAGQAHHTPLAEGDERKGTLLFLVGRLYSVNR